MIDKFHVVRNAIWALDKVRKRVTKLLPVEAKRFIKGGRRLLLANREKLDEKGEIKLKAILSYSDELNQAYCLKEWFRCWYSLTSYEIARNQLFEWYEAEKTSAIKEFLYFKKTVQNWQTQILNYFFYRVTNGF